MRETALEVLRESRRPGQRARTDDVVGGNYESFLRPQAAPTAAPEAPMPSPEELAERRRERRIFLLAETAGLTCAAEDAVIGDGILTRGGKLLVYAKSGLGKTTLMDHLTASLAAGQPFLGRYTVDRPYRVLVVQGELSLPELASHGQDLLATFEGTPAAENLYFWLHTQMKLPRDEEELRGQVHELGAEVVVLDPFICFFQGESSDKDVQVAELTSTLDRLLEDSELHVQAVAVVHHANVSNLRTAGSYKFEAWPSTILRLEDAPGLRTTRYLKFEKIRAPGAHLPEKVQILLGDDGYKVVGEKLEEPASFLIVRDVLTDAGGQLTRRDLIDRVRARLRCSARTVTNYLGIGRDLGILATIQDGRETVYRLTATQDAARASDEGTKEVGYPAVSA